LKTVYDDNLDFDQKDEKDDFGINAIPGFALNYESELLLFSLFGELNIIKYFNETDFDRTNQLYGFDGQYLISSRWSFKGDFLYRRDESIDSQLEETGQAFKRERVETYDTGGGLFYDLTELSDIGFDVDYRKREFSDENDTDFDRYTFSLPYIKRLANQRDTLTIRPAYSFFDSYGAEDATDYRIGFGWERLISETLTFELEIGGRYTKIDDEDRNDDDNFGYFGEIGLQKRGETFSSAIGASRNIRANSEGNIVEVNRIFLKADKRFLERLGFRFYGAVYLSDEESDNLEDGDKVRYFELEPSFYYLITENHTLELAYKYQNEKEFDEPGNPSTQRNQVWLGLQLKFPKKWN
jgi:hypothetical protein